MYFVLPLWLAAGFADYLCHRAASIETTSGPKVCNIQRGDTIAVFGCGSVGQFAIKSAFLLGAERVIAVDAVPERMALARKSGAAQRCRAAR